MKKILKKRFEMVNDFSVIWIVEKEIHFGQEWIKCHVYTYAHQGAIPKVNIFYDYDQAMKFVQEFKCEHEIA